LNNSIFNSNIHWASQFNFKYSHSIQLIELSDSLLSWSDPVSNGDSRLGSTPFARIFYVLLSLTTLSSGARSVSGSSQPKNTLALGMGADNGNMGLVSWSNAAVMSTLK
jgi:hypothetical protein